MKNNEKESGDIYRNRRRFPPPGEAVMDDCNIDDERMRSEKKKYNRLKRIEIRLYEGMEKARLAHDEEKAQQLLYQMRMVQRKQRKSVYYKEIVLQSGENKSDASEPPAD